MRNRLITCNGNTPVTGIRRNMSKRIETMLNNIDVVLGFEDGPTRDVDNGRYETKTRFIPKGGLNFDIDEYLI